MSLFIYSLGWRKQQPLRSWQWKSRSNYSLFHPRLFLATGTSIPFRWVGGVATWRMKPAGMALSRIGSWLFPEVWSLTWGSSAAIFLRPMELNWVRIKVNICKVENDRIISWVSICIPVAIKSGGRKRRKTPFGSKLGERWRILYCLKGSESKSLGLHFLLKSGKSP